MASKGLRSSLILGGLAVTAGCGSLIGIGDLPSGGGTDAGSTSTSTTEGGSQGALEGGASPEGGGTGVRPEGGAGTNPEGGSTGTGATGDGGDGGGATTCSLGATRCSGAQPQSCGSTGTWTNSGPACATACSAGACTASCSTAGAVQCSASGVPQTCTGGVWQNGAACAASAWCLDGACESASSCPTAGGAGIADCGSGESCCAATSIPAGKFYRGFDNGVTSNDMSWPATVSSFRLDKYEVTVARFRQFVNALSTWTNQGGLAQGAGKHAYLNGGAGLTAAPSANTDSGAPNEPGWDTSWTNQVGVGGWGSNCGEGPADFTTTPGANDKLPINCLNFYEAYAFCIWDGGFLPTEAEWHYAASGGTDQRAYPWVSGSIDSTYAQYCDPSTDGGQCVVTQLLPVGTDTKGAGKWGQTDMAGNAYEWILDWIDAYGTPCDDCAQFTINPNDPTRVLRGGSFDTDQTMLYNAARGPSGPNGRAWDTGVRCARPPSP